VCGISILWPQFRGFFDFGPDPVNVPKQISITVTRSRENKQFLRKKFEKFVRNMEKFKHFLNVDFGIFVTIEQKKTHEKSCISRSKLRFFWKWSFTLLIKIYCRNSMSDERLIDLSGFAIERVFEVVEVFASKHRNSRIILMWTTYFVSDKVWIRSSLSAQFTDEKCVNCVWLCNAKESKYPHWPWHVPKKFTLPLARFGNFWELSSP
jgi:hypothetical protein